MSDAPPPQQPTAPPRRVSRPWRAVVAVLVLVGGFAGYGIDWFGETPAESVTGTGRRRS